MACVTRPDPAASKDLNETEPDGMAWTTTLIMFADKLLKDTGAVKTVLVLTGYGRHPLVSPDVLPVPIKVIERLHIIWMTFPIFSKYPSCEE
jgi:hypothetical protein